MTAAAQGGSSSSDGGNNIPPESVLNVNIGVLGHVDSGKTSLVKALSTLLSTAALDKSKQSRQRGMTLDLGFSCFFLDMPERLRGADYFPTKTKLQVTLVDCPGHASLIRTIIGGAQIIDMVLLVVDAVKGWQAQTTECLVLAELTSPNLVVALNKADMLDPSERREALDRAAERVRQRLPRRFANAAIVGVAACVGGEKVAALTTDEEETPTSATTATTTSKNDTYNLQELIDTLKRELPPPRRTSFSSSSSSNKGQKQEPFYFSIDHCFPIRGRGTVLTGTVLSGTACVNQVLEFPALATERKIKSMQMFKKQVQSVSHGDRAGICVSNFDAKLLERGIAATPGAVQLLRGAVALVRKVPYYTAGALRSGGKFHVSVGHATIMATVTFWGARELLSATTTTSSEEASDSDKTPAPPQGDAANKAGKGSKVTSSNDKKMVGSVALGGDADMAGLPSIPFDFEQDFFQQDQLLESLPPLLGGNSNSSGTNSSNNRQAGSADATTPSAPSGSGAPCSPLLHWALLDFQTPVYCPLQSLVIGSRLDTIDAPSSSNTTHNSSSNKDRDRDRDRDGAMEASSASSCRLAFSGRLIEKVDPVKDVARLRLYTPKERRGVISRLGDPHRRTDDNRVVRYEVFGSDLFKKETDMKAFLGMKVQTVRGGGKDGGGGEVYGDVGEIKSSFGTMGKFRLYFPAGTDAREGDAIALRFRRYAHDPQKAMHQNDIVLPPARPGTRMETANDKKKKKGGGGGNAKNKKQQKATVPAGVNPAEGEVVSLKGDVMDNGKHPTAIIAGFFAPEINIKEHKEGTKVWIPSTKEEGSIMGPFGKAGKCKVSFANGISAPPGTKAELQFL